MMAGCPAPNVEHGMISQIAFRNRALRRHGGSELAAKG